MPGGAVGGDGLAQKVFDVAPAAALAAHRDRGLAAGQDHRRLAGAPGVLDRLSVHARRPARAPRLRGCRPASRPPGRACGRRRRRPRASAGASPRRWSRRAPGADRRAWASPRSPPAAPFSRCARTAAGGSMRYLASTASASAKVVRSGTVGPEPITPGSSLGTSEISQHSTRAGWAAIGEPAALDGREVLSHRVHLDDVGARFQQRAIDRLLVGRASGRARAGPAGPRRRPRSGRARDRPACGP